MNRKLVGLILIVLLLVPLITYAGVPLDTVQANVNKVLEVLRDSSLKGESGKNMKKKKIRAISEKMFDFTELSKRTLAQYWNKFNPEQRKEFIELYRTLLEHAYVEKIVDYTDEKVVFHKETSLTEKTVEVHSTIITKSKEIPIHYRVIEKDGEWRVYDVVVEGISLVNNYRTQFREILTNKPPEALLDTLRKKVSKA